MFYSLISLWDNKDLSSSLLMCNRSEAYNVGLFKAPKNTNTKETLRESKWLYTTINIYKVFLNCETFLYVRWQ